MDDRKSFLNEIQWILSQDDAIMEGLIPVPENAQNYYELWQGTLSFFTNGIYCRVAWMRHQEALHNVNLNGRNTASRDEATALLLDQIKIPFEVDARADFHEKMKDVQGAIALVLDHGSSEGALKNVTQDELETILYRHKIVILAVCHGDAVHFRAQREGRAGSARILFFPGFLAEGIVSPFYWVLIQAYLELLFTDVLDWDVIADKLQRMIDGDSLVGDTGGCSKMDTSSH
jgi:hypothetical protein